MTMSRITEPVYRINELEYLYKLSKEEINLHIKRCISKMKLFVRDRDSSMPHFFELYYEYKLLYLIWALKIYETLHGYERDKELLKIREKVLYDGPWWNPNALNEYCESLVKKYKTLTNLLDSIIFKGEEEILQNIKGKCDTNFYIYLIYTTDIAL